MCVATRQGVGRARATYVRMRAVRVYQYVRSNEMYVFDSFSLRALCPVRMSATPATQRVTRSQARLAQTPAPVKMACLDDAIERGAATEPKPRATRGQKADAATPQRAGLRELTNGCTPVRARPRPRRSWSAADARRGARRAAARLPVSGLPPSHSRLLR